MSKNLCQLQVPKIWIAKTGLSNKTKSNYESREKKNF